jgi:hypothetical protein
MTISNQQADVILRDAQSIFGVTVLPALQNMSERLELLLPEDLCAEKTTLFVSALAILTLLQKHSPEKVEEFLAEARDYLGTEC